MIDTDSEARALEDVNLYKEIIHHRKSYQRISWMQYETLNYATVSFIPPDSLMELYRDDYQTMREQMIYAETDSFDNLIERLKSLQDKFRKKAEQTILNQH